MAVMVEQVRSKSQFAEFLRLPWSIYKDSPTWVPPLKYELRKRLDPEKAPFFRKGKGLLLLARKGAEVVGRMSVSIDRRNLAKEAEREANFGCFESVDDESIANAIFERGFDWLKENNAAKVTGPIHFTLEDPYPGILVKGFENEPYFMMAYSMPYYDKFVAGAGFRPVMDLHSYEVSRERPLPNELLKKAGEAAGIPGIRLRNINMKNLYDEAEIIRDIFNEALRKNWGHIPFSKNHARRMAKDLRLLADPRFIFIAEVNGRPVGAVINLPNYNEILKDLNGNLFPRGIARILTKKKKIKSLRGYAMAVRDEYQGSGLGCLMVRESFASATSAGYERGEITWILGSNKSMGKLAEFMGGSQNKTYRLYQIAL